MFEHSQVIDDRETPDSTVRVSRRRFLSESGVYAKLALAVESFGKPERDDQSDDEPDAVTLVRVPVVSVTGVDEADLADDLRCEERTVRLPTCHSEQPILIEADSLVAENSAHSDAELPVPPADCLQVLLHLRGDELARLWTSESAALANRAYVWSGQSKSWDRIGPMYAALRVSDQEPEQGTHAGGAVRRSCAAPLGSNAVKHSSVISDLGFVALGAAAALSVILCLSRLIGYASVPTMDAPHSESAPAEQTRNLADSHSQRRGPSVSTPSVAKRGASVESNSAAKSQLEIIPLTALPLVRKHSASWSRTQG